MQLFRAEHPPKRLRQFANAARSDTTSNLQIVKETQRPR